MNELGLNVGELKQKTIDGVAVLKATCPKLIQEAADKFFSAKIIQHNMAILTQQAKDKLIALVVNAKLCSVIVCDGDGIPHKITTPSNRKLVVKSVPKKQHNAKKREASKCQK